MAGGFTIRFDKGEELRAKFKAMEADIRQNVLARAVAPAAAFVKEAIFARAPVETGLLASGIEIVPLAESADRYVLGIQMSREAFYWKFLEFGTKRMPPHPFIRAGFYSSRAQARNEMRDGIRDGVEGFAE